MTGNPTIGLDTIQPSPKLQPYRFWLVKCIFERHGGSSLCDWQPSYRVSNEKAESHNEKNYKANVYLMMHQQLQLLCLDG